MRKLVRNKKGVSEIVGTILLLGMAIALFVGVHIVAMNVIPFTPNAPSVRISGAINATTHTIYLQHNGGDPLSDDTQIMFSYEDGTRIETILVKNHIINDESPNNIWNIGEIVECDLQTPSSLLNDKIIQMIIVDIDSNTIIAQDVFQG